MLKKLRNTRMRTLRIGSRLFNYLGKLKTCGQFVLSINWLVYTFFQHIRIYFSILELDACRDRVDREMAMLGGLFSKF
jgi:hypothetical protein